MMKWCLSLQNDDLHVKVGHIRPRTLTLEIPQATVEGSRNIDVISRWRDDWLSATVVNTSLVEDPTIRLLGFDLHRRQWSLLNRLRTGQGHCNACRKKWGFTDNELCDCGETKQCHISSTLVHWPSSTAATASTWNRWGGRQLADNMLLAYDNNNEVAAAKFRVTTLEHVKSVRAQPSRVLSAAMHGATNEEREALGRQDSVKRNLRRYVNNLCISY